MFTEIVRFPLPPEATRESVVAAFATTAPVWGETPTSATRAPSRTA